MEKTCTKCGETKPISDFSPHARGKLGVQTRCKACFATTAAAYRRDHPEREAANHLRYRQANRGKRAATTAKWRLANPEKTATYSANYRLINPHIYWEADYRRRCNKHGLNPVITPFTREELIARYGNTCFYCDDGAFEEIDHCVPVAAGGPHTLANVRPSCAACNKHKGRTVDRKAVRAFRKMS